ncbi:hypothetical protein CANCADRAFT_4531 [Tortispora caseinolytica NRRL Y-17796]|uniref:Ras-GAP domain-containing protein n=1 Tax=Tortispora caseinolytica NRRL Y-17796 TaxID=767744 RepID=A0A1E4T9G8_9ASCO|nr:hypothetical protein CANCADRAFT_4531 [Tortispora caseinolytica NRRL Y-17796]
MSVPHASYPAATPASTPADQLHESAAKHARYVEPFQSRPYGMPDSALDHSAILNGMHETRGSCQGDIKWNIGSAWQTGHAYLPTNEPTIYANSYASEAPEVLFPNLRGAHIETARCDLMIELTICTDHTLCTYIQLADETSFYRWLGALLCWRLTRPAGIQSKILLNYFPALDPCIQHRQSLDIIPQASTPDLSNPEGSSLMRTRNVIKISQLKYQLFHPITSSEEAYSGVPSDSGRLSCSKIENKSIACYQNNWITANVLLQEDGTCKFFQDGKLAFSLDISLRLRSDINPVSSTIFHQRFCLAINTFSNCWHHRYHTSSYSEPHTVILIFEDRTTYETWLFLLHSAAQNELFSPLSRQPCYFRQHRRLSVKLINGSIHNIASARSPVNKDDLAAYNGVSSTFVIKDKYARDGFYYTYNKSRASGQTGSVRVTGLQAVALESSGSLSPSPTDSTGYISQNFAFKPTVPSTGNSGSHMSDFNGAVAYTSENGLISKGSIETIEYRRLSSALQPISKTLTEIESRNLDTYVEFYTEGYIIARSGMAVSTARPVWNDSFNLENNPVVGSAFRIVLRRRINKTQITDTDPIIGIADIDLDEENSPIVNCGEVWVSVYPPTTSHKLDEKVVEVDEEKERVAEIYIRVDWAGTNVMADAEYEGMELQLSDISTELCLHLYDSIGHTELPKIFTNIYQGIGLALDWLLDIIDKDLKAIHFRPESGSNVRDFSELQMMFRPNTFATRSMDAFLKLCCGDYVYSTLHDVIETLIEEDLDCEVNPELRETLKPVKSHTGARSKLHALSTQTKQLFSSSLSNSQGGQSSELKKVWGQMFRYMRMVWGAIRGSASSLPPQVNELFYGISVRLRERVGDWEGVHSTTVAPFLFLRFFCPALVDPRAFGLTMNSPSTRTQRTLKLIAKGIQGLANKAEFGLKEEWMSPMNKFLRENSEDYDRFLVEVCRPSDGENEFDAYAKANKAQALKMSSKYDGSQKDSKKPQMIYTGYRKVLERLSPERQEGLPMLPYVIDRSYWYMKLAEMVHKFGARMVPDENSNIRQELVTFYKECERLIQIREKSLRRCIPAEIPSELDNDTFEYMCECIAENLKEGTVI